MITLISTVPARNLFTRHGLHVNVRGKKAMTRKSAVAIHELTDEHKISNLIPMIGEDDSTKHLDQRQETEGSNKERLITIWMFITNKNYWTIKTNSNTIVTFHIYRKSLFPH